MENMEIYFAPLEGINGAEFRRAHQRYFGGVDRYYAPFISPTQDHIFTPKEKRNFLPENNVGIPLVPQLLTRNADDFTWAADELFAMGYDEVNLNLGCPSGTVVAKGKGAGMLGDPDSLDEFLHQIYRRSRGKITLKTRLGMEDPEEFTRLLKIFSRYPVPLLIIHPRVRKDFYKTPIRMEWFERALEAYDGELCFNGGLTTVGQIEAFAAAHPAVDKVMAGQGLLANPALARQAKGGKALEREELRAFHDELYHGYLEAFKSERNTVFHMKELWLYLARSFEGGEKLFKKIRKAQDSAGYDSAVAEIFQTLPLRKDALWE